MTNGPRQTHAIGETPDNPIAITTDGFVLNNTFCPVGSGNYIDGGVYNPNGEFSGVICNNSVELASFGWYQNKWQYIYKYIEIRGNITVTLWGTLTAKGLTLKDGASVTHAPLVYYDNTPKLDYNNTSYGNLRTPGYQVTGTEHDFDQNTGILSSLGSLKKVEISATDFIRVEDGSKLDATGRGYPGGNASHVGYPINNGGGYPTVISDANEYGVGVSGGSPVVAGGSGRTADGNINTSNGVVYNSKKTPTYYGGGGGAVMYSSTLQALGGNGGGYIKIYGQGRLELFPTAQILANGTSGLPQAGGIGGGGAGGAGTIDIGVNTIKSVPTFSKSPNVAGGVLIGAKSYPNMTLTQLRGGSGSLTNGAPYLLIGDIQAVGGNAVVLSTNAAVSGYTGSSGAGGRITIAGAYEPLCEITANSGLTSIPAQCEGKDVTLNGQNQDNFYVYADGVTIWQPGVTGQTAGTACNDSNNQFCNTKRVFSSLTISNKAILTHQAVSIPEMSNSTGNSLANAVIGTGRWHKVDITTAGNINFSGGGKIDVSSKGYPGGTSTHLPGYGIGGGGGQQINEGDSGIGSGGGGHGGVGGRGESDGGLTATGGISYESESSPVDFGSGGGWANNSGDGSINGAPGGGRVKLAINSLIIGTGCTASTCGVFANGGDGGISDGSYAGAGSGGSIWIEAEGSVAGIGQVNGGTGKENGSKGTFVSANVLISSNEFYLTANGGNASNAGTRRGGGGGGGRIYLLKQIEQINAVSIKKTLRARFRDGSGEAIQCPDVPNSDNKNCFNPYAIRYKDTIEVQIDIANLNLEKPVLIEDEFLNLHNASGTKCSPVDGHYVGPTQPIVSGSKLSWSFVPSYETEVLKYWCKVQ